MFQDLYTDHAVRIVSDSELMNEPANSRINESGRTALAWFSGVMLEKRVM
jgi:hypothetical protein